MLSSPDERPHRHPPFTPPGPSSSFTAATPPACAHAQRHTCAPAATVPASCRERSCSAPSQAPTSTRVPSAETAIALSAAPSGVVPSAIGRSRRGGALNTAPSADEDSSVDGFVGSSDRAVLGSALATALVGGPPSTPPCGAPRAPSWAGFAQGAAVARSHGDSFDCGASVLSGVPRGSLVGSVVLGSVELSSVVLSSVVLGVSTRSVASSVLSRASGAVLSSSAIDCSSSWRKKGGGAGSGTPRTGRGSGGRALAARRC